MTPTAAYKNNNGNIDDDDDRKDDPESKCKQVLPLAVAQPNAIYAGSKWVWGNKGNTEEGAEKFANVFYCKSQLLRGRIMLLTQEKKEKKTKP